MENENNDVVIDNTDSTESAPRKRAPRRAVKKSPDAPIEVSEGAAADKAPAASPNDAPADGDAPAEGNRSRRRGRRAGGCARGP